MSQKSNFSSFSNINVNQLVLKKKLGWNCKNPTKPFLEQNGSQAGASTYFQSENLEGEIAVFQSLQEEEGSGPIQYGEGDGQQTPQSVMSLPKQCPDVPKYGSEELSCLTKYKGGPRNCYTPS